MNRESQSTARSRRRRRGRPAGLAVCAAAAIVVLIAAFAAMALAAGSSAPVVGSAANAKFEEQVVVDGHGRTLYALSPETSHHLLCRSGECLKFWPPLTVRSRKTKLTATSGVHGRLGILRRSNGMLQVTLRGLPLYRFSGDSGKGAASGENVKSFGGTWHVLSATSSTAPAPAMSETTPAPAGPSAPAGPTSSTPTATPTTPTPPSTPTTPTTPTTPAPPPYGY